MSATLWTFQPSFAVTVLDTIIFREQPQAIVARIVGPMCISVTSFLLRPNVARERRRREAPM